MNTIDVPMAKRAKVECAKAVEPCLMCSEIKEPCIGRIFDRPEMINRIENVLGISLIRDKSLPETICCNCVMRINCCLEYQRCIVRNMLNHRIKYYYKIGDRANVLKYQTECKTFQTKCMSLPSGVSESFFNDSSLTRLLRGQMDNRPLPDSIVNTDTAGLIISDVRTEELPQEPDSTGDEIDDNEISARQSTSAISSPAAATAASFELLEPMFQTSENVLDTESGGNIAQRKNNESTTFQCQYCNKIYRKATAWRKHVRSHQMIEQRKVTTNGTAGPNGSAEKRKHKCIDCSLEFDTLNVLRKHSIIHEQRFTCQLCDNSFRLEHDYTWHMICCNAKNSIGGTVHSMRRSTRSQCQSIKEKSTTESSRGRGRRTRKDKVAADDVFDGRSETSRCSVDSTQTDSMYNEKIEVVKRWTKQLDIGERPDPKDLVNNNLRDDDSISVMSDMSGMTRISEVSSSSAVTVGDTDLDSSNYRTSRGRSSTDSSAWAHEQKRRKLHKAGKRRAKQKGKEYYACSFRNICIFGSTSLSKTMYHEVREHNALLLHNCVECNEWFTNKENLIRHKKRHRPHLHICISCNQQFDIKYELEHHTLLHAEKSFGCSCCEMSFLKRAELERHINENHDSTVTPKYGIIERLKAGKSENSYLKKSTLFSGYKTKELLQSPSPRAARPPEIVSKLLDATPARNPTDRKSKPRTIMTPADKTSEKCWATCSIASSCYSKPSLRTTRSRPTRLTAVARTSGKGITSRIAQITADHRSTPSRTAGKSTEFDNTGRSMDCDAPLSSYNGYTGSPIQYYCSSDEDNDDSTAEVTHRTDIKRSNTPQEPLEYFDVFSVDTLEESETVSIGEAYTGKGIGKGNAGKSSRITRRTQARNARIIPMPSVVIEKYIPPYDILFEKIIHK